MGIEQNLETYEKFQQAFESSPEEATKIAAELVTADFVYEFPGPSTVPYVGTYDGAAGFGRLIGIIGDTVDVSKFEVIAYPPVPEGAYVFSRGVEQGTLLANGCSYTAAWTKIYQFDDQARIERTWELFDPQDMLKALGGCSSVEAV
jgi:hypothetical protein